MKLPEFQLSRDGVIEIQNFLQKIIVNLIPIKWTEFGIAYYSFVKFSYLFEKF